MKTQPPDEGDDRLIAFDAEIFARLLACVDPEFKGFTINAQRDQWDLRHWNSRCSQPVLHMIRGSLEHGANAVAHRLRCTHKRIPGMQRSCNQSSQTFHDDVSSGCVRDATDRIGAVSAMSRA